MGIGRECKRGKWGNRKEIWESNLKRGSKRGDLGKRENRKGNRGNKRGSSQGKWGRKKVKCGGRKGEGQ